MTDVIVIGAGLAGLACARDLAGSGADVVVIEARERIGGRTAGAELAGAEHDIGGELIGRTMTPIIGLVAELGLELEPSYTQLEGEMTWLREGRRAVGALEALVGEAEARRYDEVYMRMAEAATGLDPDAPWTHPDAERIDALSLAAYVRELGGSEATVETLRLHHLGLSCDAPERTSALDELRRLAYAPADLGDWESWRVRGGTFQVARRMAAELGGRVRLGGRVTRIERTSSGVVVGLGGETLKASACVSTIPAAVLHGVELVGLDAPRSAAVARLRQSRAAKVVAVYDRSFWLETGQTGLAYGDGLLGSTWEQRPGVLSCLVPPERLGYALSLHPERLRSEVLAELAAMYGSGAAGVRALHFEAWGVHPYTQGYIAWRSPGDVTGIGDRLEPRRDALVFAGSDVSAACCGYMNGAVDTGRRAATALLGA